MDYEKELAAYEIVSTVIVGGVPIKIVADVSLVAKLNIDPNAGFNITTGFTSDYLLSAAVKYENGAWTENFDSNPPSFSPKPVNYNGMININQSLSIIPKVSVKIFNVIGPFCEPKVNENFQMKVNSTSLNWDAELAASSKITTGVEMSLFSFNKPLFSFPIEMEEIYGRLLKIWKLFLGTTKVGHKDNS